MPTNSELAFTKEQLFSSLKKDAINIDAEIIAKAKNGDCDAINSIGLKYKKKKRKYDKAMAWYRLAAVKNNSKAQNNIGFLYGKGEGVTKDYLLALEWYLKSAIQNNKTAWGYIGYLFEHGQGVQVDKYKALEWYTKCENKSEKIEDLIDEGIQLTKRDKKKPIGELIMETENVLWSARRKIENDLKEENKALKESKTRVEEESRSKTDRIHSLEEDNQVFRARSESMQRDINVRQESIEQYKMNEQITNEKIQSLNQEIQELELKLGAKDRKVNYLENENKLLKSKAKKIEQLEKSYQSLKELSEKEIRLKNYEIEVTKQRMVFLSETEKQKRCSLEKENRLIKRASKNIKVASRKTTLPKKNNIIKNREGDGSDSNKFSIYSDRDTEYDNDNNDINYDTPSDNDGDDENKNNHKIDGDEQIYDRNKTSET